MTLFMAQPPSCQSELRAGCYVPPHAQLFSKSSFALGLRLESDKLLVGAEQSGACRIGNIELVPGNAIKAFTPPQREEVEQGGADGRSGQALERSEDPDMEFGNDKVAAVLLGDDLLDI